MTVSTHSQNTPSATSTAASDTAVPSAAKNELRPLSAAGRAWRYLAVSALVAAGGLGLIASANRLYAPEMYRPSYMAGVAEAFAAGENYAVFDLNINIRKMRDEQLKRMTEKPTIVVLGASQWQEAGEDLLPGRGYLNAHVHRDYYEDVLGMVEMLVRHDKLPRDLVITLRDKIFTPVESRTDFLWLPGIPYFQAMAKRLSLPQHAIWNTYPLQRPRELLSLSMLFTNVTRWHNANDWPYPTTATSHPTLDLLKLDGSIRWSDAHQASFTQERSRKLALEHAAANRNSPPVIDPRAVEAIDTLLSYLSLRGVRVHLAHPPFNPIYFDAVKDSPYMEGLRRVEAVTRELAAKYKTGLVGSFDPADLGCTAQMFIDAEHSQAPCLARLLSDIANSIDLPAAKPPQGVAALSRRDIRAHRVMMASGWMPSETPAASPGSDGVVTAVPAALAAQAPGRTRTAAAPAAVVLPSLPAERPASEAPTAETAQAPAETIALAPDAATVAAPAPVARSPIDDKSTASPSPEASRSQPPRPRRPVAARTLVVRSVAAKPVAAKPAARKPVAQVVRPQRARPVRAAVAASPALVWPGDRPR